MGQVKQEYTGTWIPAAIMLNEDLKPIEKMLYAEIASFQQCWASNKWFAARLGITERTVTTAIKKLKEMQLITVVENNSSRVCVAASQILLPPLEKISTPLEKISNKNKEKNKEEKETHTSPRSADNSASVKASSEARKNSPSSAPPLTTENAHNLFRSIANRFHDRDILFTAKRNSMLKNRLKHFTANDLIVAADNLTQSKWHMGDNPNHVKYATYDFLMRNDEQVEKWLNTKPVQLKKSVF